MEIVENTHRYLQWSLVQKWFVPCKFTYVDKVECGNGATTAYLKESPPLGKTKILIAPTKGVIMEKEKAMRDGILVYPKEKGYAFIYGESDDILHGSKWAIMVADTFVLMYKKLQAMAQRGEIEFIMIDEFHATQQQSSFRDRLRMFGLKMDPFTKHCPVVSITATPTNFQETDILVRNTHKHFMKETIINLTRDQKKAIKKANDLLKKGKKVVIATNSTGIASQFRDRKGQLKAKFVVGDTFMTGLVERCVVVEEDEESNLVIISSRGFEGIDIDGAGWHMFFFENRGIKEQTFYISNLIQAINRTRNGAESIYYARVEGNKRTSLVDKEDVLEYIADDSITFEKKQNKSHSRFHPFVLFNQEDKSITFNEWMYELELEKRVYDEGFDPFETYLKERNIIINEVKSQRNPQGISRRKRPEFYLKQNEELIRKMDLFGDEFRLIPFHADDIVDARKAVEQFIRRKNYDGNYQIPQRLEILRRITASKKLFGAILYKAAIVQKEYYFNVKFKDNRAEAKRKYEEFKSNAQKYVWYFMFCLANDKIYFPHKMVGNRDYNGLVPIGESIIKFISEEVFKLRVDIFDIRNAYPRSLYAEVGIQLPDDFYGADKENKRKINTVLNALWAFNHPDKKKKDVKFMPSPSQLTSRRLRARQTLSELNLHPKVIDHYMDKYFEREHKDGFYNAMAEHEKAIIDQALPILKESAKEMTDERGYEGYGRRHDSMVFFDYKGDPKRLVALTYLDQEKWFK